MVIFTSDSINVTQNHCLEKEKYHAVICPFKKYKGLFQCINAN